MFTLKGLQTIDRVNFFVTLAQHTVTFGVIALSHLRLLGSLYVASYDSQGLRWKSSYPPPHWVNTE
jgi:hypothetical protein